MTTELEGLRERLKDKVDLSKLAVLMLGGGEQLIGEVEASMRMEADDEDLLVGVPVLVRNPKRYMRLQKVTSDGKAVQVEFFVGALDGIDEDKSLMQVVASAGYWIRQLGPLSQISFLKILNGYYQNRLANKAAALGLAVPGLTR